MEYFSVPYYCWKCYGQTKLRGASEVSSFQTSFKCINCATRFSSGYELRTGNLKRDADYGLVCERRPKSINTHSDPSSHNLECNKDQVISKETNKNPPLKIEHEYHALPQIEQSQHVCVDCGLGYSSKKAVSNHRRIHERPIMCDICEESFQSVSNLLEHIKNHHSNILHYCTVCGKIFPFRSDLNSHARIHTGERPFKCTVCGLKFNTASNLKRHSVIHSETTPFQCNVCGRKFKTGNSLKRHSIIHNLNTKDV